MILSKNQEYKLPKERGVTSRKPFIYGSKLFVVFNYDKKGFFESKIVCFDVQTFEIKWEYASENDIANDLLISEADDLLCSFMVSKKIISFNIESGNTNWEWTADEDTNIGFLSNELNEKVTVGGLRHSKSVWCLETNTGKELWKYSGTSEHIRKPYLTEGKAFLVTAHTIDIVDLGTGKKLSSVEVSDPYMTLAVHAVNSLLLVGSPKEIVWMDLHTEKVGHSSYTKKEDLIIGGVAIDNGYLYVWEELNPKSDVPLTGSFSSYPLPETISSIPKEKWQISIEGGVRQPPVFFEDCIYLLTGKGDLQAINTESGELLSSVKLRSLEKVFYLITTVYM